MITPYHARPAWRNEWLLMILIGLASLPVLLIVLATTAGESADGASMIPLILSFWLLLVGVLLYKHYVWIYHIKNGQIESRHGIIARDMRTVRLQDLRNVNVKQSFFQRIFGIGDVEFSSAGSTGAEVVFFGVIRPLELQSAVQIEQQ